MTAAGVVASPAIASGSFGQLASALVANGYRPVPLRPGEKSPIPKKWPDYTFADGDDRTFASAGTGLITGAIIGVDVDVLDQALADRVSEIVVQRLGPAPERVGQWPKRLFMYRTNAPFSKKVSSSYRLPNDAPDAKGHRVEILAQGQQFVAFGVHPGTGKPYSWNGAGNPLTVPAEKLRSISEAQAAALVTEIDAVLAEHGTPAGKLRSTDGQREHAPNEALRADPDRVRAAIAAIPNNDLAWDDWFYLGMAIKGALGDEGYDAWEGFSAKSTKKNDPMETTKAWAGFKPTRIGAGTVFHLAREAEVVRMGLTSVQPPAYLSTPEAMAAAASNNARFMISQPTYSPPKAETALSQIVPASGFAVAGSVPAVSRSHDGFLAMDDVAALALVMHAPTEDNVGRLFERQYSGALRYCKAWGCWLSWDGNRWRQERTEMAFDFARTTARAANPSGKPTIARATFAHGVEAFARAARTFATEAEQWDRDEFMLNTPGGTVDLRTGTMRPHDQASYVTKIASVTPQHGQKPVFDKFMSEITCGDASLIDYHQRSLGAMLSGARADHWLLFWIGSGRNGKNTLGDLVAEIFGDYAKTIPTETLMSMKGQAHPTEIANLRGVRLAISSEVAEGAHWNESRIKSLTGDAMLSGRFMRGDFFQFPRSHKHLIYGNNRPQLRVVDDAMRARMHVVPFPAMFSDELGTRDPLMGEKLRAEAPQILAWLIEGHVQFVQDGYKLMRCAAVRRETEDYLDTQSTPALWVKERCELVLNDERPTKLLATASALYNDFAVWKAARGEHASNLTRWGEWMNGRFDKVKSDGVRYRGIKPRPTS